MGRGKSIVLWILTVLLGLVFLMTGTMKIAMSATFVDEFAGWGYSAWFVTVIAIVELIGAVLLFIPRTAFYGALLLSIVMAGAALTHGRFGEWERVIFTLGLLTLIVWLGLQRRRQLSGA